MSVTTVAVERSGGPSKVSLERVEALDGYRAVAAIGVLVSHTAGEVWLIQPDEPGAHLLDNLGNFGVAVFFVLSGFVIFRPFVGASLENRSQPPTVPYLIRRALRLYPAYWFALVFWAMSAPPADRAPGSRLGILLLADPYTADYVWLTGLYVSWSLTVEVAFYLFLPIYALIVARLACRHADVTRRFRTHLVGLGLLYVSAFVYRSLAGDHWGGARPGAVGWLPGFLDWFSLGMLLALLHWWRESGGSMPTWLSGLAGRTAACWTIAAMSYGAIVVLKGDQLLFMRKETAAQMSWRFFFQGMAALFFVLPAVLGRPNQRSAVWFRHRALLFLGSIAYGIYLWHPVTMLWFHDVFAGESPRFRFVALTAIVLAATIPIAAASYWWLERPMMRLYHPGPRPATKQQRSPVKVAARESG